MSIDQCRKGKNLVFSMFLHKIKWNISSKSNIKSDNKEKDFEDQI